MTPPALPFHGQTSSDIERLLRLSALWELSGEIAQANRCESEAYRLFGELNGVLIPAKVAS